MEYEPTAHAKYLTLYHLIFVCKSRKKLLVVYGEEIAATSDFSFEALEVDQDNLHCLVKSKPVLSPVAIVRGLKQESAWCIWKIHEQALQGQFWKERTFWSDGYFCCPNGNASQATIRQCGEQQG
jgi:REP-associated tyrosine transposase